MQQQHGRAGAALAVPTNQIQWPAAALGVIATVTAVALSVLSGSLRGGLTSERAVWIAISVVLVLAAHLLPAFCRPFGWRVRAAGALVWLACIAATCYGHATFVMLSQRHAGDLRAAAVRQPAATGRSVTVIAADRAGVIERAARLGARICRDRCATLRAEQTALAARLDALTTEADEAGRQQAAVERADAERAAAAADPVASAFGPLPAGVRAGIAVALAAILEAVGCFCWIVATRPGRPAVPAARVVPFPADTRPVTLAPAASHESPAPVTRHTPAARACVPRKVAVTVTPESEPRVAAQAVTVAAEIAAGRLRGTVIDIRAFLACGQARAREVRHLARALASS
ncbi:hypothetical protein GIY62_00695 [Burkholderia plantarii]|uniref:hypothetical protein n=1 Tax=Burkholderia plantarii TaxID=41899 RepID=UPI00272CEBD9|nr:hypothetical protein [Burkholderia plantarii]WLE59259.1 hypothetical protein GIY62_00695 [Burkholderia plantarii]